MIRRLVLLLSLLFATPAFAQTHIVPELVAEGPAAPGGTVDVAVVMHTEQGWHGYWRNPGAAGLPMDVDWTLPAGVTIDPLRYPVPRRLLVAGLVNYVYEHDYALLTRLHVPAGANGPLALTGQARWLACTDKVCVPEHGELSLTVPAGTGPPTGRARFDEWRRQLPRPLAAPAHFAVAGDRLKLAISLPASVDLGESYFYPADRDTIDYAAPQPVARRGDTVVIDLKRSEGAAPPTRLPGILALGDGRGLDVAATPGPVPAIAAATDRRTVFLALLGALAGGLLLNLMPCVFPILALKGVHLARAGGDPRAARREALAYTAGAVLGTGVLGAALLALRAGGSAAGWAFQLQDPRTIVLLLMLATAITLNLLRTFELPVLAGERAPAGSFGTGALAAFVATPCAGPFLGAALGTALLLPPLAALPIFAALGLGLAIPFVLLAYVPALRERLPRPGPWMARLQRFLALPMAATVVACLWLLERQAGTRAFEIGVTVVVVLVLLLAWTGWRQRKGRASSAIALVGLAAVTISAASLVPPRIPRAAAVPAGQEPWSEAAVAAHLARGEPVFAYFTADWCLTCKANEAGAIDRDAVRAAFASHGVKVVVGDWTNGDPAIGRFLEARGRAGVPLYLWYVSGKAPEELPQILTPEMLTSRAAALPQR